MKAPKNDRQFQPGTYYVGDLCYILDDVWDEVRKFLGSDGEVCKLPDGRKFVMYSTAYGDGEYKDTEGREYGVDSGTIGCVKVKRGQKPVEGGHLIRFEEPFNTQKEGRGVIHIGPVEINTDPEEDDDDYCPCCGR